MERRRILIALLIYKQRDLVPNKKNTPPSNFHHVKYIATRPRVIKNELSNHGLFGNAETGNIESIKSVCKMQKLILQKSHERKNIHRGIISFQAETARQKGLNSKEAFQQLVKENIHIIAEKNSIRIENLKWVAAAHNERGHPHVHIMFWDDKQTMPQSYVSPKIPNEIRKQLIKSIFAEELREFYEEKKQATISLKQVTGEMIEEFEKAVTTLSPKSYRELEGLFSCGEINLSKWNGVFSSIALKILSQDLFVLKDILPKTGRLSFQFLPPELKEHIIKVVDELISSNEQLKGALRLYVDSRLKLVDAYSGGQDLHDKASSDYMDEAKKLIANRILKAIKELKSKDFELKRFEYKERMKIAFTRELALDVFNMLSRMTSANQISHNKRLFTNELSKQAQKEKAKELESAGGDWNGENDYET